MNRKEHVPFIVIVIIFFIVRLSILFLGIDKLTYDEEVFRAIIAKQLIEGSLVPFFSLQIDHFSGGSLVVGLLMVPFFKLFGQNLISVKLVALLFSFSSLMLLYSLCNNFFDRRVAIITSLLFIFSPPLFTKYSFITMGFHTESIFFSILFILIFFEIFFNNKKNLFYFILLGLIGGLGFWFTYIFFITLFTCVLFWFLFDRGFFLRKNFIIFLTSFAFGFSPWIYSNLSSNFSGLYIHGQATIPQFSRGHFTLSLVKLKTLLLNDIRSSFLFEDFIALGGKYLSAFYYLFFILSFVVLLWLNRKPLYLLLRGFIPLKRFKVSNIANYKEVFFLIHLVIFSLIYSLSNFKVTSYEGILGYRYLVPLYPVIFVCIALFLGRIPDGKIKGKPYAFWLPLIILLSLGLVSNFKFLSFNSTGIRLFDIDYTGSYNFLGHRIGDTFGGDIDKCISLINRVEERYRFPLYGGLGFAIGCQSYKDINKCVSLVNRVEGRYKTDFYKGLLSSFIWKVDIDKLPVLINQIEERDRSHFYRVLGFFITWRYIKNLDKCIDLINQVDERYRPDVYRGIMPDFILGRPKGNTINKCIGLINRIDERYKPSLYKNIGEYYITGIISDGCNVDECINLINQQDGVYRPYFYRSLGKFCIVRGGSSSKCISLIIQVEKKYRPYVYEGFGEGVSATKNWQFEGLVAHCINLIYWVEEGYKTSFYRGLGKGFHSEDFGADRYKTYKTLIEREVENKYIPYVYEGIKNPF